jgi:glycosyltransferase involved in cell wall biosynthesis
MKPLVSIITPTYGRSAFLPALARCVQRQQVDWEWLILDDSPQPEAWLETLSRNDPRVRYRHLPARMSIGAKRNQLIEAARGELIAHFDDDDHYASHYLADMARLLQEQDAELIKLSTFFSYAPASDFLGYMDLRAKVGLHYILTQGSVSTVEFHDKMQIGADFILFYGFSYVYRRALFASAVFGDVNLCDDESFIRPIVQRGHRVIAVEDDMRSCLHLIHPHSTSRCFSRYSIPPFLLKTLFPEYEGYPVALTRTTPPETTPETPAGT